jgi:hypothetical protein
MLSEVMNEVESKERLRGRSSVKGFEAEWDEMATTEPITHHSLFYDGTVLQSIAKVFVFIKLIWKL